MMRKRQTGRRAPFFSIIFQERVLPLVLSLELAFLAGCSLREELQTAPSAAAKSIIDGTPLPAIIRTEAERVEKEAEIIKEEIEKQAYLKAIPTMASGVSVDMERLPKDGMEHLFYGVEIWPGDQVHARINGCSYRENPNIALSQLRYLRVLYYGFDGESHVGEMIVNREIAEDVLEIFRQLYEARYPIERMQLVDDYQADDNASMAANNSSAFNYRLIASSTKLSNHSWGRAIDINPLYNPYIYTAGGVLHVDPEGSQAYTDRRGGCPYMIDHEDLCYRLFTEYGFSWGGDWSSHKDYQHFEK